MIICSRVSFPRMADLSTLLLVLTKNIFNDIIMTTDIVSYSSLLRTALVFWTWNMNKGFILTQCLITIAWIVSNDSSLVEISKVVKKMMYRQFSMIAKKRFQTFFLIFLLFLPRADFKLEYTKISRLKICNQLDWARSIESLYSICRISKW